MIRMMRPTLMAGVFAFALYAGQAHAGFQWTAPAAGSAPMTGSAQTVAPRAPAAPVSPVMSEDLPGSIDDMQANAIPTTPDGPVNAAPIYGRGMTNDPVTWNAPHRQQQQQAQSMQQAAQQAPRAPQSVLPVEQTSMYALGAAPAAPVADGAMAATPAYSNYETADGFGRDLPLVMAIRQIVPSQYGFVFDDGIDLSSHVSWQGGKPWDIVLQETLAPLRLTAAIRGNVVSITRGAAAPAQTSAMVGPAGGPVVMTDTVQTTTSVPMTATPVSMVAAPDDMSGGYVATPASNAASLASSATWTAPRNSTLRGILEDWSERVGVELYWASEYDYPVQSAVNIQGTFEEAVQTLLKGLSESRPRPMGRLHPNLPEGPAVLVIETRQNSM